MSQNGLFQKYGHNYDQKAKGNFEHAWCCIMIMGVLK